LFPGRQMDNTQVTLNNLFFICNDMSFMSVRGLVIHTPQILKSCNYHWAKNQMGKKIKCDITCSPHPDHNLAVVAGLGPGYDTHTPHTQSHRTPKVQVIYAQPPRVLDIRHAGSQDSFHPADSLLTVVEPYPASEEASVAHTVPLRQGDVRWNRTPLGTLHEVGAYRLL